MRAVRFFFTTLASLGALALFAGCGGAPCPRQLHTDPTRALDAYRSTRSHVRAVRAEARVEQWGEDGRIRGTVLMFVERPDRVRFDAMTQFGPAVILTSDGERFALTDLRENRYLSGPSCPENIERLLGIPMSGEDVSLFLLGDSPRLETDNRGVSCTADGTYLVSLSGDDGRRQEIELAIRPWDVQQDAPPTEQRLRMLRSEVWGADGETEWRATFEDYEVVVDPDSEEGMGVALPMKVRFVHPRQDADTTVRFESIDLNVQVPPNAFRQSPRPGIPPEEVTCQ